MVLQNAQVDETELRKKSGVPYLDLVTPDEGECSIRNDEGSMGRRQG